MTRLHLAITLTALAWCAWCALVVTATLPGGAS